MGYCVLRRGKGSLNIVPAMTYHREAEWSHLSAAIVADQKARGGDGEYFFSLNRYLFVARKP